MATAVEADRLELRLLVGTPGRAPQPLELEAPADATVGAAAEALAHALGADGGEVYLERTRTWLPRDGELGSAGLRHGDRVALARGRDGAAVGPSAPAAALELAVVGGPCSGRRLALAPGEHVLGRDRGCEIALDDPSLSARHLRLQVDDPGDVVVVDLGSRNGTRLEGAMLEPEEAVPMPRGTVIAAGRTLVAVRETPPERPLPSGRTDGTVAFNRPPRVQARLEPAARPFPAPPDTPQRARLPLGASLVPLVLGVGLYVATHIVTMLFFSTLAPVMAVSTYLEDRRSGRKGFQRRRREYREQLAAVRGELEEARAGELAARRAAAPDAAELLRRAARFEPALWERRPADADFLSLRLGSADRPAVHTLALERGGDASLRAEADELADWYSTAPAVPVQLALRELGAAGLCGPDERVDSLARWLVAQAAALHSPRELRIVAALAEERQPEWDWLPWLPHAAAGGPIGRSLACGPVAARELADEVRRLVVERRETAETTLGVARRADRTSVLLVLDERVAPERPLVAELLAGAAETDVGVLWLARERRDLPGDCAAIVDLDPASARLSFTDARSGETIGDVSADGLELDLARELALALAPIRDTSAALGGGIPDRVSLLELLGAHEATPDRIGARWDEVPVALAAAVGAAADGPFTVDLRTDGPHALVAGMTGAGKSELLQTLIASLAAAHPPTRLSFLLVDYKGGAAFKDCTGLPHTVGVVTDLDAHLTQRALVSLNAELQRRERVLRDAGAKDLADMERRDLARAPASLAIVIDEFATLAKEVPDFIDGVVDVAQRGRSLGVHLVLATQRPGGVVSENIRANANLRLALRVNEAAESTDVIGVPDAARIPRDRPGRAYARTGHGELTEFQTAYGGGVGVRRGGDRSIRVRALGFDGGAVAAGAKAAGEGESDLRRIVAAAAGAAADRGLARPPSPWLPPLEPVVPLERLPAAELPGCHAVVGLLDDPARQRQDLLRIDLEAEGSLLVYGTSGAGKTTFLRTLACSLARDVPPDELQVYGLDFATRGLRMLEGLPHCGSVVTEEDQERTERLFAVLRTTLARRKALFAERGVFTLSEYRRLARGESLPRLVVLLDGYAGFTAAFERVNLGELVDALPRLVGEGRPLGVHFAVTADRRGAVPNALAGIVPTKIVLRMADEDEYAALGIPPRTVRGAQLPPGRGFLPGGLELQVALTGADASGEGQARAVGKLAEELRARYPGETAPAIEPLPARVERRALPRPGRPLSAVAGLSDAELEPVAVDLAERHFLVVGPYRSGRSTALATLAMSLRGGDPGLDVHLLAPRRSPLPALGLWSSVAEGVEACDEALARFVQTVEERREAAGPPLVLVVDDGEELVESLGAPALETIVRRGRDREVRVLAAAERQAAQRAFSGWLRELRKEEHGLLLAPDPDIDGDILAARLPRRSNPVFPPGRGYLVQRGAVELVQIAAG